MEDKNQLPPEELDTDKELDKQNKQEQKEQKKVENKKALKTVVTSVICTLLFIIILLLLVLLGLKKCMGRVPDNGGDLSSSSSEPPSGPKYDYDTTSLNDKFKKIVQTHFDGPGGIVDTVKEVKVVTYDDQYDDGYFSLDITVLTDSNNLYLYQAFKAYYPEDKSTFDNVISYLLLDTTSDIPSLPSVKILSEVVSSNKYDMTLSNVDLSSG